MRVVIATRNPGKFEELSKMLETPGIEYVSLIEFDIEDIEEPGESYIENAIIKARKTTEMVGLPAIGDDSGLEITALEGYPGIKSARCAGQSASDDDKVRHIMGLMDGQKNRDARFICSLAFVIHSRCLALPSVFTGIVEGQILTGPVGEASPGLQYDSLFYYNDFGTTFADVEKEEKNRVSHRAKACFHMAHYLNGLVRGYNRGFANI